MYKFNLGKRQYKLFDRYDKEYVVDAVSSRDLKPDWYVLRYDTKTEDYNNDIVFKTLDEAYKEFEQTKPAYKGERVELIFAPENDDEDFEDNCVVNYKTRLQ